jgi:transcriptional antiterminator
MRLKQMNEKLDVELPIEEAANIAFHLINAQGEKKESKNGMKFAKMICTGTVLMLWKHENRPLILLSSIISPCVNPFTKSRAVPTPVFTAFSACKE